jgi:hypothetical protein
LKKQKSTFPAGRVKKAWAKIERSCGEANLTLHKNFLNSPDCQMAENLDPPRIAGRHFFVDIKTVHFGRNGTSNSTTEAAMVRIPVTNYLFFTLQNIKAIFPFFIGRRCLK